MKNNQNFFLAMLVSFGILWAWQYFYVTPHNEAYKKSQLASLHNIPAQSAIPGQSPSITADNNAIKNEKFSPEARNKEISAHNRIAINSDMLSGSINLQGARIDDLYLKKYHETVDKNSPQIQLLCPSNFNDSYFAEFGFISNSAHSLDLPQSNNIWQSDPNEKLLTPQTPIHLTYKTKDGLLFNRTISIDNKYMFNISDTITNNSGNDLQLSPYGRIARQNIPSDNKSSYLLHEGLLGVFGDKGVEEKKYDDLKKLDFDSQGSKKLSFSSSEGGFLGITDKYWAVAAIPQQNMNFDARFIYFDNLKEHFQADFTQNSFILPAGKSITITNHLFAGAKEVNVLNYYEDKLSIKKFHLLIDWGLFSFITRPMFNLIDYLYNITGNFGVAILLVTILLKLALFPLANKSYKAMAKMRVLQPKLQEIKQRCGEDKIKLQQATIELYKKEKINPLAGCLPLLIQMPVFFALYKVLYITLEMRHAPFFGWIKDLAAPDPTSIFNLFGALPYHVPNFLTIGAWPLIMGISMFLQMRLNPEPADPVQAKIFGWLPLIFTFTLSSFPVGLVIYWAWNNILTIIQQIVIIKKEGGEVNLFNNIKQFFGLSKS